MRFLLLTLLLLFSPLLSQASPDNTTQAQAGKNFLWKCTHNKSTIYLMGSIHLGNRNLYPLNPAAEKAFADSERLALEINLTPKTLKFIERFTFANAFYPPNQSIRSELSEDEVQQVSQFMKQIGIPGNQWKNMRPWFLYLFATNTLAMHSGLKQELGIDYYFAKKAKETKKPILELESAKFQMQMIKNLPDIKKILLLACKMGPQKSKKDLQKIFNCFKHGDNTLMLQIHEEMKKDSMPYFHELINKRNEKMTEKIIDWMKEPKTTFIVVGAAHLTGEKGIVTLLQKKGYKLTRL